MHSLKLASPVTLGSAILLLTSFLSCKSRCAGEPGCQLESAKVSQDSSVQGLPWRVGMPAKDLLQNSNAIYMGLYKRFLEQPDGRFPVPEFLPITSLIEKHYETLIAKIPEGRVPQRDKGLFKPKPDVEIYRALELSPREINAAVTRYLKAFPGNDYEYISERFMKGLNMVNNGAHSFNRTVTRPCLMNRRDTWKTLSFGASSETLSYRSFWTGFIYFAKSITEPCNRTIDPTSVEADYLKVSFPAFLLPVFMRESSFEEFTAFAHLPLYWVGVIDSVIMVDELPKNPEVFVGHDLVHAKEALDPAWSDWLPSLLTEKGQNELMNSGHSQPKQSGQGAALAGRFSALIEGADKESLSNWMRPLADIEPLLNQRLALNLCVHEKIESDPGKSELIAALFEMIHEDPVPLSLIPETPPGPLATVPPEDKERLDAIIKRCLASPMTTMEHSRRKQSRRAALPKPAIQASGGELR